MIVNSKFETMPREEIVQLQIERLQSTLNRVYRNVSFYHDIFDANRINIEDIRTIEDIRLLPFTTKDDLRRSSPYGMFAVPLRDIVRLHSTPGRTGRPIAIGYTRNDINHWSELVARILSAAGVTEHDFVLIAFDYNMFNGAFGLHYGAERLGASVIPSPGGDISKQIEVMKDYKISVLLSTPSYALALAENLKNMGMHPGELNLRVGLFGAEPWGESIRAHIEKLLKIDAFNSYGINEMMGPGVSGECPVHNGLHVNEDHFIVEIINPVTLQPVPGGEEGELVLTTITREGFPLIRYRTGDVSSIMTGPCSCGRTTVRMRRVAARTDDMIVINGVNVFPAGIEELLKREYGSVPPYQVHIEHIAGHDVVELRMEMTDRMFIDDVRKLLEIKARLEQAMEREFGFLPRVNLVEASSLGANGKMKRVIDNR